MINWRDIVLANMQQIGQFVKDRLISEVQKQGHITDVAVPGYSASLEDSIRWEVKSDGDTILLQVMGNDYILQMNEGIRPEDVSYDPRDALEFARRIKPNMSTEELLVYTTNLHAYHMRVGVPTPEGRAFSETGKRTSFIEEGVGTQSQSISVLINTFLVSEQFVKNLSNNYKKLAAPVA